jgi:hypothetical protein
MEEEKQEAVIIRPEDCLDKMLDGLKKGKVKGSTTYNEQIDQCWKWRRQEANIWTGYANEGKSIFLKQLCAIKAIEKNWKFVFCSPKYFISASILDCNASSIVSNVPNPIVL